MKMSVRLASKFTFAASALLATAVPAQQAERETPAYVGGAVTEEEAAALQGLLDAAYATLRSDLFRSNMASLAAEHPTIFLRVAGEGTAEAAAANGSVADLVDMVQAKPPFRYVRAAVALVGDPNFFFALSGVTGDDAHASFTLGRGNLGRWLSASQVNRSCAINTAAHELSHLISSDATRFRIDTQPIRDSGAATNSGRGDAIASYFVGTVAQCTWLQQQNYAPAVNLKACVRVFGHRGFNQVRCDEFEQIREIEYRADLYEEHVIPD
jgi:hypothetical protein